LCELLGTICQRFGDTALVWLTRQAPFGPATLIDEDLTVDFSKETTPDDLVTVVATGPFTRDERWTAVTKRPLMPPGMVR
jgi:predicted glutamine amidotransferase